ncbi:MAG: hypothetical protein IPH32_18130 [Bacteroidetes bacterium]|nr:hypothetical protein [Bacteroidota bacterium]
MGQHFHNGINVSRGELQFYRLTELFAERFYQYLLEESKKKIDLINPAIQKEIENADCILTFNYTQTYNIYVNNNANIDIFHLHGQLNQNNLPIIGYYYRNATIKQSQDYLEKYSGFGFHKPALAMKQNEIDFESQNN